MPATTAPKTRVITYSSKPVGFGGRRYTAWIQFADGTHDSDSDRNEKALRARVEAKYGPECGCGECREARQDETQVCSHGDCAARVPDGVKWCPKHANRGEFGEWPATRSD